MQGFHVLTVDVWVTKLFPSTVKRDLFENTGNFGPCRERAGSVPGAHAEGLQRRSLALKFELNAGGYVSTPEIAPEEVVSTPEEQVSTPEETIQRRRKSSSPLALKLEFQRRRRVFSTPQELNAAGKHFQRRRKPNRQHLQPKRFPS